MLIGASPLHLFLPRSLGTLSGGLVPTRPHTPPPVYGNDTIPDATGRLEPIGVLKTSYARGITIPRDLSVVAMLGEAMSELATPPLTTISFPADELGQTAARILVDRLDHGELAPQQVFLRPSLTVRGTTAPPRA